MGRSYRCHFTYPCLVIQNLLWLSILIQMASGFTSGNADGAAILRMLFLDAACRHFPGQVRYMGWLSIMMANYWRLSVRMASQVLDLSTERVVFSKTHANALYGVAFRSTDDLLAVAGQNQQKSVTLWQVGEPQKPIAQLSNRHSNSVFSVDFSADGKRLVSADADGIAIIWDVSDLATIFELRRLQGHRRQDPQRRLDRDGLRVATASDDQSVKLWTVGAHHGGINDLAFDKSTDGWSLRAKTVLLGFGHQEGHLLTLLKTLTARRWGSPCGLQPGWPADSNCWQRWYCEAVGCLLWQFAW